MTHWASIFTRYHQMALQLSILICTKTRAILRTHSNNRYIFPGRMTFKISFQQRASFRKCHKMDMPSLPPLTRQFPKWSRTGILRISSTPNEMSTCRQQVIEITYSKIFPSRPIARFGRNIKNVRVRFSVIKNLNKRLVEGK